MVQNQAVITKLEKKTHCLEFRTRNCNNININIRYNSKSVSNTTKFLGLIIDDTLSWECPIDQILSKLSLACFATKSVKSVMSQDTLRMMYFPYIHSITTYGTIYQGNSPYTIKEFRIKKKLILKKGIHVGIFIKK